MPVRIEDVAFFQDLSPSELEDLKSCLTEKRFAKGETIHMQGQLCGKLFFIKSGKVKIFRSSAEGREQIFDVLGLGDTCACNPGHMEWHCNATAVALTPCTVWLLPREHYVRMVANNAKLMHALNELFARRLQSFSDMIEEFTLKDSRKRLIRFLLDMLEASRGRARRDGVLYIAYTREEIAHRLGTARETVARHISDLKHRNLIEVKPYQIIIRNREALEKLLE